MGIGRSLVSGLFTRAVFWGAPLSAGVVGAMPAVFVKKAVIYAGDCLDVNSVLTANSRQSKPRKPKSGRVSKELVIMPKFDVVEEARGTLSRWSHQGLAHAESFDSIQLLVGCARHAPRSGDVHPTLSPPSNFGLLDARLEAPPLRRHAVCSFWLASPGILRVARLKQQPRAIITTFKYGCLL